jgi:putative endonuclease
MYFVYLLECKDHTIYTGITTNVARRFKEHSQEKGGAYTRAKKVIKILYSEEQENRSSALKRENAIKKLTHAQKLALVSKATT